MLIIFIFWFACSIFNYGLMVAHFQRTFELIAHENKVGDRFFAAVGSIFGPLALVCSLLCGFYKKGWML